MQADLDMRRSVSEKSSGFVKALQIAIEQFISRPITGLLTIIILAALLALPIGLYWVLTNVPTVLENSKYSPKIVVYLKTNVVATQSENLISQLKQRHDIAKVIYISPEQGLEELTQQTNINVADKLPNNPLPGVIEILPKGLPSQMQIAQLEEYLKSLAEIAEVQLNKPLLEQRYNALQFAWQWFYFLAGLFAIIAIVIIANQLQLNFLNHYGALFFNGIFYGVCAGALAWVLFAVTLSHYHALIQISFGELSNLHYDSIGKFLLLSGLSGLFSAGLASLLLLVHPLYQELEAD